MPRPCLVPLTPAPLPPSCAQMWSEGATESTSTMSSAATSLSPEAKQAYAKGLGVGISEAINALSLCNLALPLAYFCVGFGGSFIDTPLKVRQGHGSDNSPVVSATGMGGLARLIESGLPMALMPFCVR